MLRRLMTPERVRFVRFCVVGASGVVVNLAVFTLVHAWLLVDALPDESTRFVVANSAGFAVSVLTNFVLNDFWTWGDRGKHGHAHFVSRLMKFYLVSSIGGAVQIAVAYLTRDALADTTLPLIDHLAVLVGVGVATIINYVANNVWTFREKGTTDDAPP